LGHTTAGSLGGFVAGGGFGSVSHCLPLLKVKPDKYVESTRNAVDNIVEMPLRLWTTGKPFVT